MVQSMKKQESKRLLCHALSSWDNSIDEINVDANLWGVKFQTSNKYLVDWLMAEVDTWSIVRSEDI